MEDSGEFSSRSSRITRVIEAALTTPRLRADILNRRLLEADTIVEDCCSLSPPSLVEPPFRLAIVSLLFNWPSTGGGIVHTAELAEFLSRDGIDVCHFYAVFEPWGVGGVSESLPYNSCAIQFDELGWSRDSIQSAFRSAVTEFGPDAVIVTDSWNSKGMLAAAVSEFPYFIRLAALECLCPLNNVRLIPSRSGGVSQCHKTQLATRGACVTCVATNTHASGSLHAAERQLSGFDDPAFHDELLSVFANAQAILAVNPLIAVACEPFCSDVRVIPSGFDPERFTNLPHRAFGEGGYRILFAGLLTELMKGFHILFEACSRLWEQRRDFELVVTSATDQYDAPFLRYCGWQSQQELPSLMAQSDVVVVPTVAQEALGRTAVEAMGAGRPVIASRIGGLPYTITDRVTGLLFEPGDAGGLADCINEILSNSSLAASLGNAGRNRFLREYTWDHMIQTKYLPLFSQVRRQPR